MKYEKIINNFYKKNFKKNYFVNHSPLITKSEIKRLENVLNLLLFLRLEIIQNYLKKRYLNFLKQNILYQLTRVHLHYTWQ